MNELFGVGFEDDLLTVLQKQFRPNWDGIHGVRHWRRVRENGLLLAEQNHVDPRLVVLFALLHDCQRHNDGFDFLHGRRAAEYLVTLEPVTVVLSRVELDILRYACAYHTAGLTEADLVVQVCWDADRLDLGRAGIHPHPARLCTEMARQPDVIEWAYRRSLER